MILSKLRSLSLSVLAVCAASAPALAAEGKWSLAVHGGSGVLDRGAMTPETAADEMLARLGRRA